MYCVIPQSKWVYTALQECLPLLWLTELLLALFPQTCAFKSIVSTDNSSLTRAVWWSDMKSMGWKAISIKDDGEDCIESWCGDQMHNGVMQEKLHKCYDVRSCCHQFLVISINKFNWLWWFQLFPKKTTKSLQLARTNVYTNTNNPSMLGLNTLPDRFLSTLGWA